MSAAEVVTALNAAGITGIDETAIAVNDVAITTAIEYALLVSQLLYIV